MTPDELKANIDTIVIVMMENRSFDHLFGTLRMPAYGSRADLEGISDLADLNLGNTSQNGTLIQPFLANDGPFPNDLPHERPWVAMQLAKSSFAGYTMNGFVQAYEHANGISGDLKPPPMGLLTPGQIPITSFLARHFKTCDHWFAPIPTSTHPNRLMAWSGYSLIDDTYNRPLPDQDLFLDWLDKQSVRWRIYSAGLPFLLLMPKMWPKLLDGNLIRSVNELANDVQNEPDGQFPQVIVVEPDYDDSPIHVSGHACDNHPPLPMAFGETFLARVYDALTSNPNRWAKTLMILFYDEHGGFFDHVPPLPICFPAPPPANYAAFESTGPRVPAVLVSPWVAPQTASNANFDHTSILQLLAERFGGGPYSAGVVARSAAGIQSLSVALDASLQPAPPPIIPTISLSTSVTISTAKPANTDSRQAFAAAADQFMQRHQQDALKSYPILAQWVASR